MKKILHYRRLTALMLTACLLLSSCGSGAAASSMRLVRSEGAVSIANGEDKEITPEENLRLYGGYRVATGDVSYAWINLDNVKLTKMDQDTEIAITKEDKLLEIEVKSGSLFFNVTEPLAEDESMNIRISNMAVGIRGTCGWVEVPDQDHMNLYLLEGKVECTAGDRTVSVSAGETASMSADEEITVTPFTATDVPSFVIKEVKDDEDLIKAILEDSGIDILANPLISYADALSEITGELLYTDILDFEADGSPELLVLYVPDEPQFNEDMPLYAKIFRDGPEGPSELYFEHQDLGDYNITKISLAESEGRLYLHFCGTRSKSMENSRDYTYQLENYHGSIAQRDGLRTEWGRTDNLSYTRYTSTDPFQNDRPSFGCDIGVIDDRGFAGIVTGTHYTAEEYEAVRDKYSEIRVLAYCPDGENLIITPDPSELNEPSAAELIAPYAGAYTDDYHTSMSFTLEESGAFTVTGTELYGYSPIASPGVTPESVIQRVDGTILVTINENETYTICPLGVYLSTVDELGRYLDVTKVNIIYKNSADESWDYLLLHN